MSTVEITNSRKNVPLTDEQKAARAEAAKKNVEALAPFMEQAKKNYGDKKGLSPVQVEALLDVRQIFAAVREEAEMLKMISEGKTPGVSMRTPKGQTFVAKVQAAFQRAFGYASKRKCITAEVLSEILKFASQNPIVPTRTKKEKPVENAAV